MAIGDIVTGKLERSITNTGTWNDYYRPASGVEVIIFNIVLQISFGTTLSTGKTALAETGLREGNNVLTLDSLTINGPPGSGSQVVTALGTPMKLPVTNSVYLRLYSSLQGASAIGSIYLWYSGIQTK